MVYNRKKLVLAAVLSLLVVSAVLLFLLFNSNQEPKYYTVKRVIDGDTIELEDGSLVRYLGLDTPEVHHPNIAAQCGGNDSTKENIQLLSGKRVRLLRDVSDRDKYGRLLRYVFTEDGVFINYELVREGYAQVLDIPPDRLFIYTFTKAQIEAKNEGRGLWITCYNVTRGG